jgi:hypothetical protein
VPGPVTADETGRVKDWGKTWIKQRAESRPRKDVRAALLLAILCDDVSAAFPEVTLNQRVGGSSPPRPTN